MKLSAVIAHNTMPNEVSTIIYKVPFFTGSQRSTTTAQEAQHAVAF